MTDSTSGTGEPGPAWSVETLADLHAGALDTETAERLWPQVRADPEANAIIEALDATTAELGALGAASTAPLPADVVGRVDAALAREATARQPATGHGTADVVGIHTARRRRRRWLAWGAGGVTTAAAAAVAIAVLVPGTAPRNGLNFAGPPNAPSTTTSRPSRPESAFALSSGNLGAAVSEIIGVRDLGPLRGSQQLAACLAANGIDPDTNPVGVRPATIDGRPAVLVLLPTGELAEYRLLALSPNCGKNNPGLIATEIIGAGGN